MVEFRQKGLRRPGHAIEIRLQMQNIVWPRDSMAFCWSLWADIHSVDDLNSAFCTNVRYYNCQLKKDAEHCMKYWGNATSTTTALYKIFPTEWHMQLAFPRVVNLWGNLWVATEMDQNTRWYRETRLTILRHIPNPWKNNNWKGVNASFRDRSGSIWSSSACLQYKVSGE